MAAAGAVYPSLANRVVLVTGGGSGIGAAVVACFARQNAKVGFLDIDDEASAAVKAKLAGGGSACHFEHCDLRDIPALRRAIDATRRALGPITILVNNAARDDRHATEEVTPEYWDERFAVNLKHQFFAAQAVLPDMKAAGGGAIVNFGSVSWMAGLGGMVAYTACKSAVLGLTRSLARDYGRYNIRVNAVAPGWVLTERQRKLWLTPEAHARLMEEQCLKRELTGEDIAKVVVFLASDEAGAITGQHMVVDGGRQ
ncbi:MAG TPA: SDR family NAD(P)-dependent oxidoreductase [Hyphomicrobiaceae bacterium]|nr:SDR family NAD(P)-dependent oxidoreductase [Hyphomicrobiaceae bacterium]